MKRDVTNTLKFQNYKTDDLAACLRLFDSNCPKYFAPNERVEYIEFLKKNPVGYEVCLVEQKIVGAYGLLADDMETGRINWIMIDPEAKSLGIGSAMMRRALENANGRGFTQINIAASHLSEPFLAKFGAVTVERIEDGWGNGMHRNNMILSL